ncbi:unnamed protein product, partial [Mesorhabditis spiculigera]
MAILMPDDNFPIPEPLKNAETWRNRHTFHYFTTEWKPTETNIQKLHENSTAGPPNDLRPELVTWQTAEKPRYFVFTAPRFLEVDLDNYTMIKTVTAVFTEHLVDKDWNRNSYQIEKINDGAAKQVPETPLEAENVRPEVPRTTKHSFSSFELFLLFLMGMGLLFLAVCIMGFVCLWCLMAEYFYGKYIDRNHRPTSPG